MPRITSTNFITGTGFMKCMPMTLSGRPVAAASLVIEIDEVFEARIACGGAILSSVLKTSVFTPRFSVTASITNEALEELRLRVGEEAYAVIKASDVMVGKDD